MLVRSEGLGEQKVAVRLRDDAPLPWEVKGVIRDPQNPNPVAPELRAALSRNEIDRPSLAAAVAPSAAARRSSTQTSA